MMTRKHLFTRIRRTLLTLAITWMVGPRGAEAGVNSWTTTGPAGGTIEALVADPATPGTLYAGTQRGVFKSTDGGRRWDLTDSGASVLALAIDPQAPATVYAGTSTADVLKSTDAGATWSATSTGWAYSGVFDLAVDPQRRSIVYACTGGGVFKSTDEGATWTLMRTGLTGTAVQVYTLVIDPAAPDTLIAGTANGIFKSTNGGMTWSATGLYAPLIINQIVIHPGSPDILYAGTGRDIYRSADGGWTWTRLDTGLKDIGVRALAIDPARPTTLYAGNWDRNIYKSEDGGDSWAMVRGGAGILALVIDPFNSAVVFAGTREQGVYRSADGGVSWSPSSTGMRMRVTYDLAIDPRTPTAVYASTFGGLLKSPGGESGWIQTDLTVPLDRIAIDPGNPDTLYAGTVYDGIHKSTDGGATWVAPMGGPRTSALAVSPEMPAAIYAGDSFRDEREDLYFGILKSTDGAKTWTRLSLRLSYSSITSIAIDPRTPGTVYAGSAGTAGLQGRGLFKSVDAGGSWSAINVGLGHGDVRAVVIDPEAPATLYAATYGGGVFKSTDGGGNWSAVNAGLTDLAVAALAVDPRAPSSVYAGTAHSGVFRSTDGGGHWAPLGPGLPPGPVRALAIDSGEVVTIHAATDMGVFDLTESAQDTTAPVVFMKDPAEGATVAGTIVLTADAQDDVSVAGVQFLVDDRPLGPEDTWAPYEMPWDTRGLADGTHRITALARDAAGNTALSDPVMVTVANGPLPSLSLSRSEETAGTLEPPGAWAVTTNEGSGVLLSGSEAAYAAAAGAAAIFSFTGTGVRWIGLSCEICGIAEVTIDGVRMATVDTFARERPEISTAMYTSPRLPLGGHTLEIVVTGVANAASGGAFVVVDAVDVMLDGAGFVVLPAGLGALP